MADYNLGTARGRIDIDSSGVERSAQRTRGEVDDTKKSLDRAEPSLGRLAQGFGILQGSLNALKMPVVTQGIYAAVGAVGALTGGVIALVSALAPLSGALPALAVGYTAVAQGLGVVKLATHGLDDALKAAFEGGPDAAKKMDEALKGMDPSARRLVTTIAALKPQFEGLRNTAQAGLFPGVIDAINEMTPMLNSVLRPVIAATAQELGNLARSGGSMMRELGNELRDVGLGNVPILHSLGEAAITLVAALTVLLRAAQPLAQWLANLAHEAAGGILSFLRAGEASGRLAAFFDKTRTSIQLVMGVLFPLIAGLGEVGRAAYTSGNTLLTSLGNAFGKFNEWAQSVQGQTWLREFFELATPVVQEFGRLAGAAFTGLMQAAKDVMPILPPIIEALRTQLLPAILDLVQNIDGKFILSLIELATAFTPLFGVFAATTPLLNAIVRAMIPVIEAITWLMTDIPFLSSALQNAATAFSLLGTAIGLVKIARFLSDFKGLSAVINTAKNSTMLHAAATKAWALIQAGATAVTGVATGATAGLAAAVWSVLAPVLLVIAAIGVVVGVFLLLTKVLGVDTKNAILIIISLIAPFIGLPLLIINNWGKIGPFFGRLWDAVWGFFSNIFGKITGFVGNMIGKAVELGTRFVEAIVRFYSQLPGKIAGFLGQVIGAVAGWVGDMIGKAAQVGRDFFERVMEGFRRIAGGIRGAIGEAIDFVRGIPGMILGALGDLGGLLFDAGKRVVQGLINGIRSLGGAVKDALLGLLPGPLKGFADKLGLASPSKLFAQYGRDTILGFIKGIEASERLLASSMANFASRIPSPTMAGISYGSMPTGLPGSGNSTSNVDNSRRINANFALHKTEMDEDDLIRAIGRLELLYG